MSASALGFRCEFINTFNKDLRRDEISPMVKPLTHMVTGSNPPPFPGKSRIYVIE